MSDDFDFLPPYRDGKTPSSPCFLFFGIIDIAQKYDLEAFAKGTIVGGRKKGAHDAPKAYADKFIGFMQKVFRVMSKAELKELDGYRTAGECLNISMS